MNEKITDSVDCLAGAIVLDVTTLASKRIKNLNLNDECSELMDNRELGKIVFQAMQKHSVDHQLDKASWRVLAAELIEKTEEAISRYLEEVTKVASSKDVRRQDKIDIATNVIAEHLYASNAVFQFEPRVYTSGLDESNAALAQAMTRRNFGEDIAQEVHEKMHAYFNTQPIMTYDPSADTSLPSKVLNYFEEKFMGKHTVIPSFEDKNYLMYVVRFALRGCIDAYEDCNQERTGNIVPPETRVKLLESLQVGIIAEVLQKETFKKVFPLQGTKEGIAKILG